MGMNCVAILDPFELRLTSFGFIAVAKVGEIAQKTCKNLHANHMPRFSLFASEVYLSHFQDPEVMRAYVLRAAIQPSVVCLVAEQYPRIVVFSSMVCPIFCYLSCSILCASGDCSTPKVLPAAELHGKLICVSTSN